MSEMGFATARVDGADANCLQRVWNWPSWIRNARQENKERMTQMGHSHTLAIFGKMLLMKNLFPGACDEQIESW
jgi:hypothetical protein